MLTIVDEDFSTYADGALATVGSARWRDFATSHFSPLNVVSHQLAPNAVSDGAAIIKSAVWGGGSLTDQWAEVTVGANGDFKGCGVFGDDAATANGNAFYGEITGSSLSIMIILNGSFAALWTNNAVSIVPGDVIRFSGRVVAGPSVDLAIYQNGVVKAVGNDSRLTSGGIPFARMWFATAGSRISRFTAGDFSTPPAGTPQPYYRQQQKRHR